MKREIKFKAKIKGDAGIYTVWGIDWLNGRALIERACGNELIPFKKIQEFLQFTGIFDKDGKEIFEGMSVEWITDSDEGDRKVTEIVEFKGGAFYPICMMPGYEYEIVGNKFENPGLL